MNEIRVLQDGSVPLARWLNNALAITDEQASKQVLEGALALVRTAQPES